MSVDPRRIDEVNDLFRKGERPDLGRIMLTSDIRDFAAAWPLGDIAVNAKGADIRHVANLSAARSDMLTKASTAP